jgi:hypothetical protein
MIEFCDPESLVVLHHGLGTGSPHRGTDDEEVLDLGKAGRSRRRRGVDEDLVGEGLEFFQIEGAVETSQGGRWRFSGAKTKCSGAIIRG